jgi:CelD/BcsL family acetyltransferase involved in cellulose biosynthesis
VQGNLSFKFVAGGVIPHEVLMNRAWDLKVYRRWDEVDDPSFIAEWKQWMEQSPQSHVFSHPAVLKAWTDTYRSIQNISPFYCVARKDDTTVFMPFVLWRRNWKNAFLNTLVPAGYSDYDYHDPLVTGMVSEELMHSFWDMLLSTLSTGEMVGYDIIELPGIRIPGRQENWSKSEICPYTDFRLFKDHDDYIQKLSKSVRGDLKKRTRRLEELGELSFHVYDKNEMDHAVNDFKIFLVEHTRKWPNAYKAPGFHDLLFKSIFTEGLAHYSQVRLDGRPISWELGFRYGGRVYGYMPVYVEEYSKYSIGKVHLIKLFQDCFERGISIYDFMRGAESYKADWAQSEDVLYRYDANGHGSMSRIKMKANAVLSEIKKRK